MYRKNKVEKARKRLKILTDVLFKLFQINLRYKETREDYGVEIFEYFYLPWRSDKKFKNYYKKISEFTLNPSSRLYTLYDLSKRHLLPNTTFLEVGCWKGGASGLVALTTSENSIDYILCDTFKGVVNSSERDSFFKGREYADTNIDDVLKVEKISGKKFKIVEGIFPGSVLQLKLDRPISFAHIDVDTYISAKESFEYIAANSIKGAVIVLDDYGGWFTDGVTTFGNELKEDKNYFVTPNHLGQLIIYKIN